MYKELTKKVKALEFLIAFAEGDTWKEMYMRDSNNSIHPQRHYNSLKRTWNDGRGLLVVAEKNDDCIYYNSLLLSKTEKFSISKNLTEKNIKHIFVDLGYPDYYSNGLISQHNKINLVD